MIFLGCKSTFKFSEKEAAGSVSVFVVLLACLGLYVAGCDTTYFASSALLCDSSVEGVSCEEELVTSHPEGNTKTDQKSSQNLLDLQSPFAATKGPSNTLPPVSSQNLLDQQSPSAAIKGPSKTLPPVIDQQSRPLQ